MLFKMYYKVKSACKLQEIFRSFICMDVCMYMYVCLKIYYESNSVLVTYLKVESQQSSSIVQQRQP